MQTLLATDPDLRKEEITLMDASSPYLINFQSLLPYIDFSDVLTLLDSGFDRVGVSATRAAYSDGAGHVLNLQIAMQHESYTGKVVGTLKGPEGDLARMTFSLPEAPTFLQELPVGTLFPTGFTTFQAGTGSGDRMSGWLNDDLLLGRGGNDRMAGDDGNDILFGLAGRDTLLGGRGNDILIGGLGFDRQVGGAGKDILIADDGTDVLRGGAGPDALVVLDSGGNALLADFDASEDTLVFVRGMTGGTLSVDDWASLGASLRGGGTPLSDLFGNRSLADLSVEELASVGLSLTTDSKGNAVIQFGTASARARGDVKFEDISVTKVSVLDVSSFDLVV